MEQGERQRGIEPREIVTRQGMWFPSRAEGKVGCAHAKSLVEAASVYGTSSPGHSRGRFVQARPAMHAATSRCQAQAQPAQDNQTAGNALATTIRTAAAYDTPRYAILASEDRKPDTYTYHNWRAGAALRAAPHSSPPLGLPDPSATHMHAATAERMQVLRRRRRAPGRPGPAPPLPLATKVQGRTHAALYQAAPPPAHAVCSSLP